jgi:hypothetical protein
MKKDQRRQVRAVRAVLESGVIASRFDPYYGNDAQREEVKLRAFMSIFHPEIPQRRVNELVANQKRKRK